MIRCSPGANPPADILFIASQYPAQSLNCKHADVICIRCGCGIRMKAHMHLSSYTLVRGTVGSPTCCAQVASEEGGVLVQPLPLLGADGVTAPPLCSPIDYTRHSVST